MVYVKNTRDFSQGMIRMLLCLIMKNLLEKIKNVM